MAKIIGMARPRKNPEDRKDYHLRVPLSTAQHAIIEEAVRLEDQDKAAWARAVLLETGCYVGDIDVGLEVVRVHRFFAARALAGSGW